GGDTARISGGGARWGTVHTVTDTARAVIDALVLGVVEDVEGLPAEVDSPCLAETKALEQAEVKVYAAGAGQCVPAEIPEGETGWGRKRCWVVKQGPANCRNIRLNRSVRIANQVRTRPGAHAVSDARGITKVRTIGDAERLAALGDGDTGYLPSAQN